MPLDLDDLQFPDKADGSSFFFGAECNAIRDAINKLNAGLRELAEGGDAPVVAVNPTHRTGASLPANSLGVDADTYLNTVTGYFYQRKAGVYVFIMATKGADGKSAYQSWLDAGNVGSVQTFLNSLAGEDGEDGSRGTQWYRVFSKPANTFGQEGDFAFEAITLKTYRIYHKENGVWELITDQSAEPSSVVAPPVPTTYTATLQSYTATCGVDKPGSGPSVTRTNATETSTVSQADANAKALSVAQAQALAALVCTVAPGNVLPTANAGSDATIQLPTNTIQLQGLGSDSDGSVTSYQWTQITGPNTAALGSSTSQNTTAAGLVAGVYQFRLTVTDDKGGTKTDDVVVTVNASAGTTYQVMVEADSTAASLERNGSADAFLEQLHARMAAETQFTGWLNFGWGGDTWTQGAASIQMNSAAQRAEVLSGKSSTAAKNILFLYAGINEMQYGASAQASYNAQAALVSYYQSQGFTVIVNTITGTRSPLSPENSELWQRIRAYNNLLRTAFNNGLNGNILMDIQTHPQMGGYDGPLNTEFFRDLIHYTPAGSSEIADFAQRALPFAVAGTRRVINYSGTSTTATLEEIPTTVYTFFDSGDRANGAVNNGWVNPEMFVIESNKFKSVGSFSSAPMVRPANEAGNRQRGTTRVVWAGGERTYGTVCRYNQGGNYYMAYFVDAGTFVNIGLFRINSFTGVTQLTFQTNINPQPLVVGTTYSLTMVAFGDRILASLLAPDGSVLAGVDYTDSAPEKLSSGTCGLTAGSAGLEYLDFFTSDV
ncbi:GDSL-type esterase/lipase family protein [Hymenobacter sp. YC55]|uniref:SGNH/GDSL hydrolase family protein n=1 Tax=Hymenobacter sp. YC55 TaxID=3034019 RepID=UPI0023FA3D05|nr:GDSL-type esterase/lipase family protein [Hymenobacter sp. YC55]MDF7810764.1 GDSL-type esterase/lipase family protein [Hymenobacter sp. YC55]